MIQIKCPGEGTLSQYCLDHAGKLRGFDIGDGGDKIVWIVEPFRLYGHCCSTRIKGKGTGTWGIDLKDILQADVVCTKKEGEIVILNHNRDSLIEPDGEGGIAGDAGSVEVVVKFVLLDPEEILIRGIGNLWTRNDAALDNCGVAGVFHAAKV